MSVYRPSDYQVNTGRIVDRTEGLRQALSNVGGLYQSYLDDKEAKRVRSLQEARQAEQDAMARELHQARMGEIQRAEDTRKFMQEYDPGIGIGGKGVEESTQRAMAEEGGDVVTKLLKSRGIKTTADGEGMGLTEYMSQAPEADRQSLLAGLSDVGSRGLGRLQATATQEPVRNLVFQDVLKQTGDAIQARAIADQFAAGVPTTRQGLQEQEAARTKDLNESLQRQADAVKDDYERRKDAAEFQRKQADKLLTVLNSGGSSGKGVTGTDMVDVQEGIKELGLSGMMGSLGWDEPAAQEMARYAFARGYTPAEVLKGVRNLTEFGTVDDTISIKDPDKFVAFLEDQKNKGRLTGDARAVLQEYRQMEPARLTPEEANIIEQAARGARARGTEEVLADRGRGAFGNMRLPVAPTRQTSVATSTSPAERVTTTRTAETAQDELTQGDRAELARLNREAMLPVNASRLERGNIGLDLAQEALEEESARTGIPVEDLRELDRLQERVSRYRPDSTAPSAYANQVRADREAVRRLTQQGLDMGAENRARLAEWLNGLEMPEFRMPYARNLVQQPQ